MSNPAGTGYTQEEIDVCLTAVIAHAGRINTAVKWLRAEGKHTPDRRTLTSWTRIDFIERYEELREKLASVREEQLANDYLDAASRAIEGAQLATEKAIDRLKAGKDEDPAKSAASLARVSQSMIEKRLTLQGRPTRITETIDVEARVRKLVAMGVLQLADGDAPALEPGDEE